MQSSECQFCSLDPQRLFQVAEECCIRVTGTIKTIFQHKRYIVEVWCKGKVVMRSLKRYSDFEALFQITSTTFKNIDLNVEDFPSKYQVFGKDEHRKKYFEGWLNAMLRAYVEAKTTKTNQKLLSTLLAFLTDQSEPPINNCNFHTAPTEYAAEDTKEQTNLNRNFHQTPFIIKFQNDAQWKERYFKLEGSILQIYKHKSDNKFTTAVEMYQAKVQYNRRQPNIFDNFCQKMQFNHYPTYSEDPTTLSIYHQYDNNKLLIRQAIQSAAINKKQRIVSLSIAKELISEQSKIPRIRQNFIGVFEPIGKLLIVFYSMWSQQPEQKNLTYIRVQTPTFVYQTQKMLYTAMKQKIKQAFLIPISDTFENIIITAVSQQSQGFIREGKGEQIIGHFRIAFSDYLTYPHGYGLERTTIRLDPEEHQSDINTFIQLSIRNQSHFTSIYSDSFRNENDGFLSSDQKSIDSIIFTVDRVLRIVGTIALFIQTFWRNVYLFKYPRMGYVFFTSLTLLFLFATPLLMLQLFIITIFGVCLYNSATGRLFIDAFMNKYVFQHLHSMFIPPEMISKSQVKYHRWSKFYKEVKAVYIYNLQGKLQKKEKNKGNQFWIEKHGRVFVFKEQAPGLIDKVRDVKKTTELVFHLITVAVNTIQKICNIFCGVDPHRTIFILFLLYLISSVANVFLLRGVGILFCIHRLWKGQLFFKVKHYASNRRLTVHALKYILNRFFPELAKEQFQKAQFPIQDEAKGKLLKTAVEGLINVYVDAEELAKRANGKSLQMEALVRMISSCESRLKLEWIPGKEGTSLEFQELKNAVKEVPVIDLWLESLLINLVLNVPSQLYTTFRKIRSNKAIKYERHACDKEYVQVRL